LFDQTLKENIITLYHTRVGNWCAYTAWNKCCLAGAPSSHQNGCRTHWAFWHFIEYFFSTKTKGDVLKPTTVHVLLSTPRNWHIS